MHNKEIQKSLVILGHDLGDYGPNGDGIDGKLGDTSKTEIKSWQTTNGFEATGRLTSTQSSALQEQAKEHTINTQTALVSLGHDLGDFGPNNDGIDGKPGNDTTVAIQTWQKEKGYEVTGSATPDQLLILQQEVSQRFSATNDLEETPEHTEEEITAIQKALIALSFDLGEFGPKGDGVDGNLGEKSIVAIKKWQEINELEQTGYLTDSQRDSLSDHADVAKALDDRANEVFAEEAQIAKDFIELSKAFGNAANPADNKWKLEARMTGTDKSVNGYTMATGTITLTDPQGKSHSFPFRSGGLGKYGNNSMLPGLDKDLTTPTDGINASYKLNFDPNQFIAGSSGLPKAMLGPSGRGYWMQLGSNPDQTTRGGVMGVDWKGFFGIHTDGLDKGSQGCMVLSEKHSKELFAFMKNIPENIRPEHLHILEPEEQKMATAMAPSR